MTTDQRNIQKMMSDPSMYEVIRNLTSVNFDKIRLTVAGEYLYVNHKALMKFDGINYVRFLIRRDIHRVIIEPCEEQYRDTFRWCSSGKNRNARRIKCVPFTYMIYEMMGWNCGLKYDVAGRVETSAGGQRVIVFELDCATASGTLPDNNAEADAWAQEYRKGVTVDMAEGITVSYEESEAERKKYLEAAGRQAIDFFEDTSVVKVPMNVREQMTAADDESQDR